MRLDELASALRLTYQGDGALELAGLCSADRPRPGHLSFALSPRYLQGFVKANCACVVIIRPSWLEAAVGTTTAEPVASTTDGSASPAGLADSMNSAASPTSPTSPVDSASSTSPTNPAASANPASLGDSVASAVRGVVPTDSALAFIFSDSPYDSFVDAMGLLCPEKTAVAGVHPDANVHSSVVCGERVSIEAYAVVGAGVVLGDDVRIGPGCCVGERVQIGDLTCLDANAVVYSDCTIGRRCRLHANCVIGAEGFGHLPQSDGGWRRIPHHGTVCLGDDVRVGAGTTIDRAVFDATVIESGVKLDNLIHIGHNARIGSDTAIAAGALVSGHAHIGKRCRVAGNASFAAVDIADDTTILGATSISKNISEPGNTVLGYMGFMPARHWRRWLAFLHRLYDRAEESKRGQKKSS